MADGPLGTRPVCGTKIPRWLLFSILLQSAFPVSARVITVPPGGSIQGAINSAVAGDEIVVQPATYYQRIDLDGKNITVRSTNPASSSVVASTIIDALMGGAAVTFSGAETNQCVLSGFTIRNGRGTFGAGIVGNGTRATIQYCVITRNEAGNSGGGLRQCNGTIRYNTISFNSAVFGAGLIYCNGTIQYNTITNNTADNSGGALSNCNGFIRNNTIRGNHASFGGALYGCGGPIRDNVITDNTSEDTGGGLAGCRGLIQGNVIANCHAVFGGGLYDCDGTIQNNVITGNSVENSGGGLSSCDGTIQNNIISDNQSSIWAAGLNSCNGTIQGNIISGNIATSSGGALDDCDNVIQNNIIWANRATRGAGLAYCDGNIRNNTIWGNTGTSGNAGIYTCHGTVRNCIVWQNTPSVSQVYDTTATYCCIQNWTGGGAGNISLDPRVVNAAGGDFHLRSDSPCIDAGCRISGLIRDFEGDVRPLDGSGFTRGDGSDYDIGADEFEPPPTAATHWSLFR